MTLLLFALVIVALGAYSLGHSRGVALEGSRHLPYSEPRSIVTEYPVCIVCKRDHAAEVGR